MIAKKMRTDRKISDSLARRLFTGNRVRHAYDICQPAPRATLRALAASGMLMHYNH